MLQRDQIHGDIEFSEAEQKLIQCRSFDRLRYIKQLGFVERSFPGAVHTRYQHSLGVCACVTDMYNAVCKNNPSFYRAGDLELLRMMALVHDFGHAPFSHASEELSDILHEDRLYDILEYEAKNIVLASDYDIEAWELLYQVYNGTGAVYLSDKHLIALHGFLDNFIDADKLDYLARDSYNCGVAYGNFDRHALISSLTTIPDENGIDTLAITSDGVQALEGFILARYYMFSKVYMEPYERLMRYLYVQEMKHILPDGKYPNDVRKFLQLDDTKYVRRLKFLQDCPYELVYDAEFNAERKELIDRKLGKYLLPDVARKNVFRKDIDDRTIMVKDKLTGELLPCSEASPILRSIEYTSVNRMRYYAEKSVAKEVSGELSKILRQ